MPSQLFVINGKPIAKKRPRFATRKMKDKRTYIASINDQETEEGRAYLEIRSQWPGPALSCPIKLFILALFEPTKASVKKVDAMLNAETKHIKKPDVDNIEKFYMDVLTGLVWVDDSQVWYSLSQKGFSKNPQTIITVEW